MCGAIGYTVTINLDALQSPSPTGLRKYLGNVLDDLKIGFGIWKTSDIFGIIF